MASAVIISGAGAYADAWHPFDETSHRLAELISSADHDVRITEDVEGSLLALGPEQLVVINVGNPRPARPTSVMIDIQESLLAHLGRGGGLLAMHVSATSFTTMPRWSEIIGGHWVRGTSMHPPLDLARIRLRPGTHPAVGDQTEVDVHDERYSYLDVGDDVTVIGDHLFEDRWHPMIWAREHGPGRVLYDGLGHDGRSYESRGHRDLISGALTWLIPDDRHPIDPGAS